MIHPTAIIAETAQLGSNVEIGPYCVINDNVKIGNGCKLHSHVVIDGTTSIGEDCEFFPFAAIGGKTQDLKYQGEPTSLVIGDRNVFRENTTVHRSTDNEVPTLIGDDNLFLAYAHVAHDCVVGNHTIFSNNATIAGHVTVEDYVIISGLAGIHQFCRVGKHSIVGGCTKIVQDVPPFVVVDGNPATVRGINVVGLQRRGFSEEEIKALKKAYKALFLKKERGIKEGIEELKDSEAPIIRELLEFIGQVTRGLVR